MQENAFGVRAIIVAPAVRVRQTLPTLLGQAGATVYYNEDATLVEMFFLDDQQRQHVTGAVDRFVKAFPCVWVSTLGEQPRVYRAGEQVFDGAGVERFFGFHERAGSLSARALYVGVRLGSDESVPQWNEIVRDTVPAWGYWEGNEEETTVVFLREDASNEDVLALAQGLMRAYDQSAVLYRRGPQATLIWKAGEVHEAVSA